jgi:superfamily II DNA or RNA helicase
MTLARSSSALDLVLDRLDGRGRGFERLNAWFLLTDPEWAVRIAEVWLWDEWPGRWGQDRGIDLVARTHDGELIAIQAKHYGPESTISKSDVDSFLSESSREIFSERLLIGTTHLLSAGARQVIAAQEKPVTLILRDRLEESLVDWGGYGRPWPTVAIRHEPLPHQQRAINDVLAGLAKNARGQLIMPCGTGKTLTSLWIAHGLDAQTVLIVLPTRSLLRQTAQVWSDQSRRPTALLRVCSDAAGNDEIEQADLPLEEVGGPPTTDPDRIAQFLRRDGRRVILSTYDSTPRIAEALAVLGEGAQFDLVICDEGHHCAGLTGSLRKTVLDDDKVAARRRLFATATPTVYGASAHAQAAHAYQKLASMNDPRVFGTVLHRLTFKQAVELDLLCPYQVAVMPVTDADVAEMIRRRRLVTADGENSTNAFSLAAQLACLRAMRQFGAKRLVAFHSGVPESRRFNREIIEIAAELLPTDRQPERLYSAHVDGYMNRVQQERLIANFRSGDDAGRVLNNVRLLAEGIDISLIDAICFMDTNHNPAWIAQAVGRAMRRHEGKMVGTVILPVIVGEGQEVADALRSSEHKQVLDVLAAMRTLDEDIVHTIDSVRVELGPDTGRGRRAGTWVVDAPTQVDEQFAEAVQVSLVDVMNARSSTPRRRVRRPESEEPERESLLLPDGVMTFDQLDFSDPRTLEVGLSLAQTWRDEYYSGSPGIEAEFRGFPLRKWWRRVLRIWEDGQLPREYKIRCAALFNWLTVDPGKYGGVRSEMAKLDPVPLADRIDEWLDDVANQRDDDLLAYVRLGRIGGRGSLRTEDVLDLLPETMPPSRRVEITLKALKLAAEGVTDCISDMGGAALGFEDGLRDPGRPHGMDVRDRHNQKPSGRIACYAHGWDTAQRVLRLIEAEKPKPRPSPSRRHTNPTDQQRSRRHRRRGPKKNGSA